MCCREHRGTLLTTLGIDATNLFIAIGRSPIRSLIAKSDPQLQGRSALQVVVKKGNARFGNLSTSCDTNRVQLSRAEAHSFLSCYDVRAIEH